MAKREQIVEMIRRKAAEYDFDPDLAVRIAELESSLNPNARNRRSSAVGLYQLTDARRREIGAPAKRVLSLDEQVDYGLKSLSQAAKYLEDRLERKPEPFEIYAAHFSGPMGSVKVLKADPSTPIDRVLSARAVRANPDLRGRTTGQVVGTWQEKLGDFAPKPVPVPRKEFTPGPPLDVFEFEKPAGLQLYAQGPRPEAEPVASEPQTEPMALMAEGGMVDDEDSPFNQRLARMVEMARSDDDFARINRMLAGGPQGFAGGGFIAVGFDEGGEVKKERSAKEMLADMGSGVKSDDSAKARLEAMKRIESRIVDEKLRDAANSSQYGDLVEFLASRRVMPEMKYRPGISGEFVSGWGMPNRGEINLGMSATPGTVVHELTHAADRQISQQYYDLAKKRKLDPLEKQFVQTYEKLVFSPDKSQRDPEKYPRTAMAERLAPEWAKKERGYRSTSGEMVAFGMGRPVDEAQRYMPSNIAPPHVDPTMATEFSVLLDIAKRLQKSKPVTDKR